jgi:hypothetical protein
MERKVKMTSRACTQGAFFGSFRESAMAVAETQDLFFSSSVVLVWWCFGTSRGSNYIHV